MPLLYIDTNVIMDFMLDRRQSDVFEQSIRCFHTIMISSLVIKELEHQKIDASSLLNWLHAAGKLIVKDISMEDIALARRFSGLTHWNDALHAASAINNHAEAIVTSNIKDFKPILKVMHPDDI